MTNTTGNTKTNTEIIYEKKPFKCNILMLFFSWTKAKKQDKKEQQKNDGKKDKTTRKEQKTRKKRERERERQREVKETKENERETLRNEPRTFFRGKQCFVKDPKKHKNKKVWRPIAQKHTCNAALPPFPRRIRKKEKNTSTKKGGLWRGPLEVCENGVAKKTGKDAKTLAPQPQGHLATTPNPTENPTRPRAHRASNLRSHRTKCEKCPFRNELGSAAPRVFYPTEIHFCQNFELRNTENSNARKNYPQERSAKWRFFDAPKGLEEVERRGIVPKPLVL